MDTGSGEFICVINIFLYSASHNFMDTDRFGVHPPLESFSKPPGKYIFIHLTKEFLNN